MLDISISHRRVGYLYTPSRFHTGGLLAPARGRPRSVVERGGDFSYYSYFVGFPRPVDNCPRPNTCSVTRLDAIRRDRLGGACLGRGSPF